MYKRLPNDNGLGLYVCGCAAYVGVFVVTKELTRDFWGHMIQLSHEEYKSKEYTKWTLDTLGIRRTAE